MTTCPRCHLYVHGTDRACPYCTIPLLADDFTPIPFEPPRYIPAADRRPDEEILVYCCRCVMDEAFWTTTVREIDVDVALHVWTFHADAPGPHLPDGRPEWAEGRDWWLCTKDDVIALHAVRNTPT